MKNDPLPSASLLQKHPQIRWFLGIILILSLVLAVDFFFLHILLPMKRLNASPTLDVPSSRATVLDK